MFGLNRNIQRANAFDARVLYPHDREPRLVLIPTCEHENREERIRPEGRCTCSSKVLNPLLVPRRHFLIRRSMS